jgi:MFS family permease
MQKENSLWQNLDFVKLWSGQTFSEFGSRITRTGLPIVALVTLGVSAKQMGFISAIGSLPSVLFGLFAGVLVDKFKRKPMLITTDIVRCLVLLTIPIAFHYNQLTLFQLYFVTVLSSICGVFFNVAYRSYLPTLIERKNLVSANAKISLSNSIAEVSGPGIAGVLIVAITAPFAIIFDSISFLVSAFSLLLINKKEESLISNQSTTNIKVFDEITQGIKFVFKNKILLSSAFAVGGISFFFGFFGTLYSLYAIRVLNINIGILGLIISIGGVSSIFGSMFANRITKKFGVGKTMLIASFLIACSMLCIPLAGYFGKTFAIVMLSLSQLGDCFLVIYFINDTTIRQITPDNMLGRMNSAMQLFEVGLAPFGALIAGFLADYIGIQPTMFFCATGGFTAFLILFFSPTKNIRNFDSINLLYDEI